MVNGQEGFAKGYADRRGTGRKMKVILAGLGRSCTLVDRGKGEFGGAGVDIRALRWWRHEQ